MSKKLYNFAGILMLATLILTACAPEPTPDPCQAPEGWQNEGKSVTLSAGNRTVTIQLFVDEENGILFTDLGDMEQFPPKEQRSGMYDGNKIEYFLDCDGNVWVSKETAKLVLPDQP